MLEAAQKSVAHFTIPITNLEEKRITLQVEDPDTPFDNQYFIIIPKPIEVSVRLGATVPNTHPIAQAFAAEPGFKVTSGTKEEASTWVVQLPSRGATASLEKEIQTWLEAGRTILLFPNSDVQNNASEFLYKIGLKGITEEGVGSQSKSLKQPDVSDAFYKLIFEKEVKNMKMPEAQPVLSWQSSYHTILKFTDNSPFLSTFKVGNGTVHLFASPITKTSAFVAHPLFVPILYQLALGFTLLTNSLSYEPVEGALTVSLERQEHSPQPYVLKMGELSFIPDQKIIQNQLFLTLPEDLRTPGFYNLEKGGSVIKTLALNTPREESVLECYSLEELEALATEHGGNIEVVEPKERISLQKQMQKEASGSSLWKYCLILCFLCLLVEAYLLSTRKSGSLT
jgi:hypothetical protein